MTNNQAFHQSVQQNQLIMKKSTFEQYAKKQLGITFKHTDFLDLKQTPLLETIKRRLIEMTEDWDDYRTKMTAFLLSELKANPLFEADMQHFDLNGVNIVTGEQLIEDFTNHYITNEQTLKTALNLFEYQIAYLPYGLYIWSDSVESAINVETMDNTDASTMGISNAFYTALTTIPAHV